VDQFPGSIADRPKRFGLQRFGHLIEDLLHLLIAALREPRVGGFDQAGGDAGPKPHRLGVIGL